MLDFITNVQLERGLISESDMSLLLHTTSIDEACDHIMEFYSNYHSQRYAGGQLILRIRQAPDEEELERLNREYDDIIVEGRINRTEPTQAEIEDGDALDYDRISFVFDRRHFGRLRQLVNDLNAFADLPGTTQIPTPMGEEQAERPW